MARMSLEELRQLVLEEISKHEAPNYVPASKQAVSLMKMFARLLASGYEYSPLFHDSSDGVTWPVVVRGNDKQVFEHDDSMFVRDDETWLELDHGDLSVALNRLADAIHVKRTPMRCASNAFWDDIRYASIG